MFIVTLHSASQKSQNYSIYITYWSTCTIIQLLGSTISKMHDSYKKLKVKFKNIQEDFVREIMLFKYISCNSKHAPFKITNMDAIELHGEEYYIY